MIQSLINIFNLVFYQPLLNLLFLFYQYLPGHNFGIAIIFLTLLIRILLYPLSAKAIRSQKALQDLQPKISEVQKKYKDSKEKQATALMELYRNSKISPFSGISPLLIQFPILIALYRVFTRGLNPEELVRLYSFVPRPEQINSNFFGTVDLKQPFFVLAILAGILQFIQMKMTMRKTKTEGKMGKFSNILQKQTLYFFPIFTIFILMKIPSAISLYLLVTTMFSIFQQHLILKPRTKASLGTGQET